jgi:hypothetical protein
MFHAMPAGPEHSGWKLWKEIGVAPRPCDCPTSKRPVQWIFLAIALLLFVGGVRGFDSKRPTLVALSNPLPTWERWKPDGPSVTSGHGYYLRRAERGRNGR